ncbi:histidine phosphatase family protein [Candidatus Woesearchaeota archaeon]|nr:histidine phosphatase family protein [Candidatus Woesearchaeota archaeon]
MKLLLTRHGEVKNDFSIINLDGNLTLTESGILQTKKLAEYLKLYKLNLIISSNLLRCKDTSKIIQDLINVPIVYNPLLNERNSGDFEGKSKDEINWEGLGDKIENLCPPNGESFLMVQERAKQFLNYIFNEISQNEIILIVSHEGFLKIFIGYLLGINIQDSIFKLKIHECSLTEIDFDKKYKCGFRINFFNDTHYLN